MKGKNLRSLLQCLGIKFSVIARVCCADVKRRETKELYSLRSPFCCRQRNQRNVNEIFLSSLEGSSDFPNFNIVKQLSYIEWKSCVPQIPPGPFKFQCTFYKLTSQNSACSKIVPLYNAPVLFLTGLTSFLDISRSIYIFVCDSNGGRGKIKQIKEERNNCTWKEKEGDWGKKIFCLVLNRKCQKESVNRNWNFLLDIEGTGNRNA